MSIVKPNLIEENTLAKIIENKSVVDVGFCIRQCDMISVPASISFSWRLELKSEKPKYIIIGLQTDKSGNQERNAAILNHCNITDMHVVLNSTRYPAIDYHSNFAKQQLSMKYV